MAAIRTTTLKISSISESTWSRDGDGDLVVVPHDNPDHTFYVGEDDVLELVSWLRMAFPLTADIEIRPAPGGGTGPASHVEHSRRTPA